MAVLNKKILNEINFLVLNLYVQVLMYRFASEKNGYYFFTYLSCTYKF